MTLHIGAADGAPLALPDDAVTQTFGVLAKRGVGKTYAASVLAEELFKGGHQVVVLDPLDVWWGLRASADGKGPGLPVYVFGGEHADIPLDAAAGKLVADTVVEQRVSVVLSLRHLSKSAQRRFVADFAERLYERKGEPRYRTPVHVIIDEADSFAPQRVMSETARMLGAIDDLVRRGRSSGVGVTLISQRAASLNKDVLTQIEVLVCLRTISPQDRKALEAWIEAHDTGNHAAEFMASLASLDIGEAWVWSPGWLDVFVRVRIRKRRTYDSSSTPKAGEWKQAPARLVDVDLGAIRDRMAKVVQEAEANDPKKLRAEIAQLRRKLAMPQISPSATSRPCGHEREIPRLEGIIDTKERELAARAGELESVCAAADIIAQDLTVAAKNLRTRAVRERTPRASPAPARMARDEAAVRRTSREPQQRPAAISNNGSAPGGERSGPQKRVIDAAGALHDFGIADIPGATLAAHARYRYSGGFRNILSELRGAGLLVDTRPKVHRLTDAGMSAADFEPVIDVDELRRRWLALCSNSTHRLLEVLIEIYPDEIAGPDLAARCEREYSGGFRNLMSELCTMSAATRPRAGALRAADALFPEGAPA